MQQITTQPPSPPTEGQHLGEEEETFTLDEGLVMDIYSLTYNELQKKIVQESKKHFPNDLTHLAFIKEKVIMMNTKNNSEAIAATNLAFTRASKSNTLFNGQEKKMEKNLQVARKYTEKFQEEVQKASLVQVYLEELKAAIHGEVSALGDTMRKFYEEIVCQHDMQQKFREIINLSRFSMQPSLLCMSGEYNIQAHLLS